MKKNKLVIGLFILFICLLSLTIYTSFSSNIDEQEIVIKSMTPVYDETSTIKVDNNNIIFNDKNQVVRYDIVLENTQNYDVKISDIKLSTPTEEFLQYKVEGISKDDVLSANSTKELTISFETMGIKGWGRNFADELTANISFEKVAKQEEVIPPVEEEKQPEAPVTNIEEIVKESEKLEVESITNNTIEFKDGFKVEDASKVETWIYPETEFYGYKEVDESNIIKEIVLEKERLDELEINPGEHNILLTTEEKEILGYIDIYINENKEILIEKPQDTTDKEDLPVTKPSTDNKDDDKVENPYTSNNGLVVVFGVATFITGIAIIFLCNKKVAKYTVFILMLSPSFTITNAEKVIEVAIKNSVSFESQNIMKKAYSFDENNLKVYNDYWQYRREIKNIYIQNEITEIDEYAYIFDVTETKNQRVTAYLVANYAESGSSGMLCDGSACYSEPNIYYDLYLQADGIIYANPDTSYYFAYMQSIKKIDNLEGLSTSNVTNMESMFERTGFHTENLTLDLSSFDTRNVTNMENMFYFAGKKSTTFKLDVSRFDTSNVTDMSDMFSSTGYSSTTFTLDVSNFNTSNVTDMAFMFYNTGYNSTEFTLDLNNFDTSSVIDMMGMLRGAGYNSTKFNTEITIRIFELYEDLFCEDGECRVEESGYDYIFYQTAIKPGTKIKVNYTKESEELVDKMLRKTSSGSNVVKGDLVEGTIIDVDNLSTGDGIYIDGEIFNVISQTDDTITMLAEYNLGSDYRQSVVPNNVKFSETVEWEYEPGEQEIDIQTWSTNPKTYINAYVDYLKEELNDNSVTGDLITLKELKKLGCRIQEDYSYTEERLNCEGWVGNHQSWWTRSAISNHYVGVWYVSRHSIEGNDYHYTRAGVRPVITISKSALKEYLKA